MKMSPQMGLVIVIALLVIIGAAYFLLAPKLAISPTKTATSTASQAATATQPTQAANIVTFSCTNGSIAATFGTNSVQLALSDGRTLTLPQTVSGSGIRYESTTTPNDDIVFESEGSNAFLTENGKTTYDNCLAGTISSAGGSIGGSGSIGSLTGSTSMSTFTDASKTFTFTYPSSFTVSGGGVGYSMDWMVNATTSGMVLAKLTVPSSFEPSTNFVGATLTVGTSADPTAISECTTYAESGGGAPQKSTVTINGVTYTKFATTDAAAGNDYQTTSYRVVRNSQCYAIEYTIHSGNIENYPPHSGISSFNEQKVESVLNGIVQSFKFL